MKSRDTSYRVYTVKYTRKLFEGDSFVNSNSGCEQKTLEQLNFMFSHLFDDDFAEELIKQLIFNGHSECEYKCSEYVVDYYLLPATEEETENYYKKYYTESDELEYSEPGRMITVNLSAEDIQRLEKCAAAYGTSMSSIIRQGISNINKQRISEIRKSETKYLQRGFTSLGYLDYEEIVGISSVETDIAFAYSEDDIDKYIEVLTDTGHLELKYGQLTMCYDVLSEEQIKKFQNEFEYGHYVEGVSLHSGRVEVSAETAETYESIYHKKMR